MNTKLAIAVAATLALGACSEQPTAAGTERQAEAAEPEAAEPEAAGNEQIVQISELGGSASVGVYKDTQTGCHYIVAYQGGVIERRDRSGERVCD